VVVVTAKDLTDEDRRRLNGSVMRVVSKGGGPDDVVNALKDLTGRRPGAGDGRDEGAPASMCAGPAADGRKDLDPDDRSPAHDQRDRSKGKMSNGPEGP